MKIETIKKHILEIAKRDLYADNVYYGVYDNYFPDEFGIEHYDYDYTPKFCQIMTDYANTEKVLKIILMDAEGDYYVTESRIWAMKMRKGNFWDFENTVKDSITPDYIQKGHYMSFDRKIVQILDNQEVIYSSEPYSESEMLWRKHFLEDQVKAFCERLR